MIDFSDPTFITAVSSAVAALTSVVVAAISARKTFIVKRALDKAKLRETYCVCPKCKKRIPLSELSFYLPDGSKDNDLNGVPDSEA